MSAILSAREPRAACLDSGKVVAALPAELPAPAHTLDVGQFTLGGFINGQGDLLCPRGHRVGIFTNPAMAQATAEFLSR